VDATALSFRDLYTVSLATMSDRAAIYPMRHAVYASELGQHPENGSKSLQDPLDLVNEYVVVRSADGVAGFISITSPKERGYSVDKYFARSALPVRFDEGLYELRLLTVRPAERGTVIAALLMYAGFRWVSSQAATHIIALGRSGATVKLYEKVGLRPLGLYATAGAVTYEVMHASIEEIRSRVDAMRSFTERLRRSCRWSLPIQFDESKVCYHGGASISAIGDTFADLSRAEEIITADVLDAWFPPAPDVTAALREHLPYLLRTSPPTDCSGLLRTIAGERGVSTTTLVPGAGSSDLIFRAFREWLRPASRVLMLDPTYGEYAHVAEHVIGCRVARLSLDRERGYRVDLDDLHRKCQEGYDLIVLVNPNSPTGQVLHTDALLDLLSRLPSRTRLWIDETYIDYCGEGWSMEQAVTRHPNLVVCKSMSKVYALSGARVAYLVASPPVAQALRAITPPWIVGAPAQLAAIRALGAKAYYRQQYRLTRALRERLAAALGAIRGIDQVTEGVANFLLCDLDPSVVTAITICERCRERSLYLRDLRSMSGRADLNALRIAVKDGDTNRRMVEIIRNAISEEFVSPGERALMLE
jgi:histidinol-phosphate/aromatic aminotransferase/cobyric acid decarboxylase-like protein/GNAT superfamily N-acetyltransferase